MKYNNMEEDTRWWLEHHSIPYDELYIGCPAGDYYINDKGVYFSSWPDVAERIQTLERARAENKCPSP